MSGYRLDAPAGRWIDRERAFVFRCGHRDVPAFAGDTVASALLAAGFTTVARSVKLHRPRGVFSCGVEEPNALFDVGSGAARTPNTRATDMDATPGLTAVAGNAWPSPRFDLAAINDRLAALLPAGFYYKTFMWPHWHLFEPAIRALAGLGHAAPAASGVDPDRYDEVSKQIDVLVVGGGAAGMAAALAAAQTGRSVLLVDGAPRPGGWAAGAAPALAHEAAALAERLTQAGVALLTRCTVVGLYDDRLAVGVEQAGNGCRERLWKIRARRIVLATGAFERPLLFPDNDRPGVMLAGAVQRYAALYGVACGRRVVVATACDSGYAVAQDLLACGVPVQAIVDLRPQAGCAPPPGLALLRNSAIVATHGRHGVQAVTVAARDGSGRQTVPADCVASAGGWTPAVHLHSMAGGRLDWDEAAAMFVPVHPAEGIDSVGACAGVFDFAAALAHAAQVGAQAGGVAPVGGLGRVPADLRPGDAALSTLARKPGKIFIDLQSDVSAADVALAARENYRSVEHLKRYTTAGMATDQGKTSNVNALVLLGAATGRAPAEVGTTRFRPPFKPVTLNALAGGRVGARIRPLKRLPAHDWHAARGAQFDEYGGWLRPAAYPLGDEPLHTAAEREALHVRTAVGLFDGSPLGKLEIYGPDAADFLDLMYVGTMSTLPVGGARYGLLLNENGVIVDDGIVARLAPQHFWVNTTSGGAARVALAFDEWLQCEYVNHRVLVTPVTADWGNVTVSGPRAWDLLRAAGCDAALAPAQMPHMAIRVGTWRGVPLRVLRASFTGELSYELNAPATAAPDLLRELAAAGGPLDARPYGVEALMILRTEKGYLHVGGDTDGTTLPGDVGMDRGVAGKRAHFVGRRSLLRPAAIDPDRLHLVGLLPADGRTRLPVGAQVCATRPPARSQGFVTSSCFSPALGHPVALGMLQRGRQRLGERITVWHMGASIEAVVTATPFFDVAGERLRGF
ncbi:MAG: 2Fe-2S iron-sulfur cluster-binding protein [Burkholderiaceae bacterium]|nr:2Fe-2S iron-sulfur cluster-binding protein [Burkholderiaceae bacterium]